jgi:hypothetical protein
MPDEQTKLVPPNILVQELHEIDAEQDEVQHANDLETNQATGQLTHGPAQYGTERHPSDEAT